MQRNAQLSSAAGRIFITMSVTSRLLHKCKVWSWTSPFPLVTSCTKLPWYHSNWGAGRVLGFEGFVFSLLPPFGYIYYDQNTMLFSVFLSEGYWTRCSLPSLLQALYRLYFITCSLLLILPIHVLSLTQLLSTHSVLSSPSCLLILSVNPSYQFGIQKRQAVSFLHELRATAHPC